MLICRCEEITEEEIIEAIRDGARSIAGIRRRTRAGMGLCQGRTCRRLVASILAKEMGISPDDILSETRRPPLRPLKVDIF
ncbi:(2Fe-2S)-binding protein [bacterium]|nr:(2Fe-2S)-binding protein [bacterium]